MIWADYEELAAKDGVGMEVEGEFSYPIYRFQAHTLYRELPRPTNAASISTGRLRQLMRIQHPFKLHLQNLHTLRYPKSFQKCEECLDQEENLLLPRKFSTHIWTCQRSHSSLERTMAEISEEKPILSSSLIVLQCKMHQHKWHFYSSCPVACHPRRYLQAFIVTT